MFSVVFNVNLLTLLPYNDMRFAGKERLSNMRTVPILCIRREIDLLVDLL